VWTVVGAIVYVAYGYKHSRVGAAMNAGEKGRPATTVQ
jgi:hypothetical protein